MYIYIYVYRYTHKGLQGTDNNVTAIFSQQVSFSSSCLSELFSSFFVFKKVIYFFVYKKIYLKENNALNHRCYPFV